MYKHYMNTFLVLRLNQGKQMTWRLNNLTWFYMLAIFLFLRQKLKLVFYFLKTCNNSIQRTGR